MRHSTTSLGTSSIRSWAGVLAAAGLWAVAGLAHAGITITTAPTVQAASDGSAITSFNFAFDPNTPMASFDLNVVYDPSLLTLDPVHSTTLYNGATFDPTALFGVTDYVGSATPGLIFAVWSPLSLPNPLPTFSGSAVINLAFTLASASSAPVSFSFDYGTVEGGQAVFGLVNGQVLAAPVVSTITAAVPEPETWALMFAGLSLLALLARRRAVQPQA